MIDLYGEAILFQMLSCHFYPYNFSCQHFNPFCQAEYKSNLEAGLQVTKFLWNAVQLFKLAH